MHISNPPTVVFTSSDGAQLSIDPLSLHVDGVNGYRYFSLIPKDGVSLYSQVFSALELWFQEKCPQNPSWFFDHLKIAVRNNFTNSVFSVGFTGMPLNVEIYDDPISVLLDSLPYAHYLLPNKDTWQVPGKSLLLRSFAMPFYLKLDPSLLGFSHPLGPEYLYTSMFFSTVVSTDY